MSNIESFSTEQSIAFRLKTNSSPNGREDPFKIGLVIEGGGMRGVISGGEVTGLQALGALPAFDALYTVSAGSCAGAYFITGQTPEGTSIYYQDINNQNFIDLSRPLQGNHKKGPIVDIPFLTHEVMFYSKPLNWEKVAVSKVPLHIYATSAKDAQVVDLSQLSSQESVHDSLHFTSRIPVFAGLPFERNGRYYTDGSALLGGIPLQQAVDDNCTHILVLQTLPDGVSSKDRKFFDLIVGGILRKDFPELAKRLPHGRRRYRQTIRRIHDHRIDKNLNPRIDTITIPFWMKEISQLETDATILYHGAIAGYDAVLEKLRTYDLKIDNSIVITKR